MASKRLDILLVERGLAASREQAQAYILAGTVWTGERRLEKAGDKVKEDLPIEVRSKAPPFASRAGQKLEHGLDHFKVVPAGKVCLDVGASTGGFTDCLLKRGATHVFAVDVGYGQIDQKLREHPQVTNVERCNARYMTRAELVAKNPLAEEISLVAIDVSFISLTKIMPQLRQEFPDAKEWLILFKPQFEVGRENIGKGGVVRNPEAVTEALAAFQTFVENLGFRLAGPPESSPLTGKKSGNLEYLLSLNLGGST